MQIWQLFHILKDYCDITHESASMYCNMIKYLLRMKTIHPEQSIYSVVCIDTYAWRTLFRSSSYSIYNVDKLKSILANIEEYISTYGIESIVPPQPRKCIKVQELSSTSHEHDISKKWKELVLSSAIGFVVGYLWAKRI